MYAKNWYVFIATVALSSVAFAEPIQVDYESVLTPCATLIAGDLDKNEFFIVGKDDLAPLPPEQPVVTPSAPAPIKPVADIQSPIETKPAPINVTGNNKALNSKIISNKLATKTKLAFNKEVVMPQPKAIVSQKTTINKKAVINTDNIAKTKSKTIAHPQTLASIKTKTISPVKLATRIKVVSKKAPAMKPSLNKALLIQKEKKSSTRNKVVLNKTTSQQQKAMTSKKMQQRITQALNQISTFRVVTYTPKKKPMKAALQAPLTKKKNTSHVALLNKAKHKPKSPVVVKA